MNRIAYLLSAFTLCLGLAACGSSVQEDLGLKKKAPDEFAVVKRAPLELPPSYSLRPPEPGAPRPQEQSPVKEARQTVFGEENQKGQVDSDGESLLLDQAGAGIVRPDIRAKVDSESSQIVEDNRPVAEKLLGLVGKDSKAPASVVDAKAEAARIQKNAKEGKPITEGETPAIVKD